MLIQNLLAGLAQSFQSIGYGLVLFIPKLILAIALFILAWVIGSVLEKGIAMVIRKLKLDAALNAAGIGELVHKAGYSMDSGAFIGALIKWFIVIAVFVPVLAILGLNTVALFLAQFVLGFLPKVIIAAFVLLIASVLANVLSNIVTGSAKAAGLKSANFLGSATKWVLWIFGIIVALSQVGIATQYFQTIFIAFMAMLALALGLAFGLGGRDAASDVIRKMRDSV